MSLIGQFAAYAAAFEQAFASNDWSALEPFFTEDAAYVVGMESLRGGTVEGRDAVLDYLERALDSLDRRFDSRELTLIDGPREEGQSVWIRGTATYRSAGVPDFVLELEELVTFTDGRISRLEDRYSQETQEAFADYASRYGDALGLRLPV